MVGNFEEYGMCAVARPNKASLSVIPFTSQCMVFSKDLEFHLPNFIV